MSQRLNLSIELGKQARNRVGDHSEDQQLSIVVLGSFTGDAGAGNPLPAPKPSLHPVDIDSFDGFMARMKPTLEIDLEGCEDAVRIDFKNLEDFHPDQLYDRLTIFQSEPGSRSPTETSPPDAPIDHESKNRGESDQQTLARLLGKQAQTGAQTDPANTKKTVIESVVRKLATVSSQTELNAAPVSDPRQPETAATMMRQLLHHNSFQALESRWRGLDWLVRNIEPDEGFQLYVMNLSREVMQNSFQNNRDIHQTDPFRVIQNQFMEHTSSEHKLILIYDESFAPIQEEIALLEGLGSLAESLDATLIAAADDCFAEDADTDSCDLNAWIAFRKSALADRITLVLPRILLRLPYGRNYDPIDAFAFEELDPEWRTTDLLWGNPAYALGILLAARRVMNQPSQNAVLTDCPAFAFERDDERQLQPCTEHLYHKRQIARLLDLGLVPVIGSRRSNTIQLPGLQSL